MDEQSKYLEPDSVNRRSGANSELADIVARLDQLALSNENLRADNTVLKAEVVLLRADNEALRADNEALRRTNVKLKQENGRLNKANLILEKATARLEKANKILQIKLDKTQSEVKKLKDSLDRSRREQSSSEKGNIGSGGGGGGGDGGSGSGQGDNGGSDDKLPQSAKAEYEFLCQKKDPKLDFSRMAKLNCMSLHEFWISKSSDPRFLPAVEDLMRSRSVEVIENEKTLRFDDNEKERHFGKIRGLHSSFDETRNYNFRLTIHETMVRHETLRDESQSQTFDKALSIRKRDDLVIPNTQITTHTLISLITLHCEYKVPMRRLEKLLTPRIFTADNISRWLTHAANHCLPIYLHFPDQLGQNCNYLYTDDTNTHVLKLKQAAKSGQLKPDRSLSEEELEFFFQGTAEHAHRQHKPDLLAKITKRLGRVSAYASGKTGKTKIHMTLVCGKFVENDWRSMICFFRTHLGQAGNLISRIYEPFLNGITGRKLSIQADCSGQNHVENSIKSKITVTYPGCSDHARRPFKRFAEEDENLAYSFLLSFLHLYNLEREIKCGPLLEERILKIRSRGYPHWNFMHHVSQTVIDGKRDGAVRNRIHKPHSNLFKGCQYIINNFQSLTLYLTDARLSQTNGISERKLRPEKLFINSSKFSNSELDSASKDILQTMIATTIASGRDPAQYFHWVLNQDAAAIESNPAQFTPFAFACSEEQTAPINTNERAKSGQTNQAMTYLH